MRLYHAVGGDGDLKRVTHVASGVPLPHLLISFAYLPDLTKGVRYFKALRELGARSLFLDCGAFTVHQRGDGEIPLRDYEHAIETLQPDVYVQLDVIGDAAKTRANLERMRKDGFDPVPIFTRGASWDDLRRLKDEAPYIALGNISNGRGTVEAMRPWLDAVFAILGPGVKTHGFGVSSPAVMTGWPFFSVDSAAMLKAGIYGLVRTMRADGTLKNHAVNVKPDAAWRFPECVDVGVTEGRTEYQGRRAILVGRELEKVRRHATKVWASRGVVWADETEVDE